jgi:hypothetical protein
MSDTPREAMKHEGVVFDLYHEKGKPMWEEPLPRATAFLSVSV